MYFNKRGVSPLIATVLLIAFAVALGAVVMNWGKGYIEGQTLDVEEKSSVDIACSMDVDLELLKIGNSKKICFNPANSTDNSSLEFMLENRGSVEIVGLSVSLIGDLGAQNILELEDLSILIGSIYSDKNLTYLNTTIGDDLQQVIFKPYVDAKGTVGKVLCSKGALVVEDISEC
jgi:flagellin-like protein